MLGSTKETIYTCYVTNTTKSLLGYVSLRLIVTSSLDTKVKDLMYEDVISVEAYEDQEDVAKTFRRYGFTALPVVDSERRLIGIITVDDIMDIMELETTEDFQSMSKRIFKHLHKIFIRKRRLFSSFARHSSSL